MPEENVTKGKEPPLDMRAWLADALCALNQYEEHESSEFCAQLVKRGPPSRFHSAQVGQHLSWLNYHGLITYRKIIRNGHRLALKRGASESKIRKVLTGDAPPPEPEVKEEKGEEIKGDKVKKKRKKKAPTKVAEPPPELPPETPKKKKKRNCCDDPHVVRSRKTGKRRCKNCGKKYKTKKPKD